MSTNSTILNVWMNDRVPVSSIAALLSTTPQGIEDALRNELLKLRAENTEVAAPPKPEPVDTERIKRGGPKPRSKSNGNGAPVLAGYPEELRHPLATTRRTIWDALTTPKHMEEIERETKIENGALYQGLKALRDKCLAHKRDSDGKWERTVQE